MLVLIVEPDPAEGLLIRVLLEREQMPTIVVQHVDEGLATLVEAGEPFMVLVDHAPPESDALQMLDAVRTDPRWASLPVVLLTSEADEVFVREAVSLEANSIVSKPFRAPALVQVVRRAAEQGLLLAREQREVVAALGLDLRGYQRLAREIAGQISDLFGSYGSDSKRSPAELEADLQALDKPLFQFGAYRALSAVHATLRELPSDGPSTSMGPSSAPWWTNCASSKPCCWRPPDPKSARSRPAPPAEAGRRGRAGASRWSPTATRRSRPKACRRRFERLPVPPRRHPVPRFGQRRCGVPFRLGGAAVAGAVDARPGVR